MRLRRSTDVTASAMLETSMGNYPLLCEPCQYNIDILLWFTYLGIYLNTGTCKRTYVQLRQVE